MQEEGLTNEGRHHLLLLYKEIDDKKHSRHYMNRARLTACEVGVVLREISQLVKIRLSPY